MGEFRLRPLFSYQTADGTHSAEGWLKHTAGQDRDRNRNANRPARGYRISIYVLYRKYNVIRPHVYLERNSKKYPVQGEIFFAKGYEGVTG